MWRYKMLPESLTPEVINKLNALNDIVALEGEARAYLIEQIVIDLNKQNRSN